MKNWEWTKALAESSMFWTQTENIIARMEAFNDTILVTAPSLIFLEKLQQPRLKAWQITIKTLTSENYLENSYIETLGQPISMQHVGLKLRD